MKKVSLVSDSALDNANATKVRVKKWDLPDFKLNANGEFGKFLPTAKNFMVVLKELYDIRKNKFDGMQEVNGERVTQGIISTMRNKVEEETGLRSKQVFGDALNQLCEENQYNPVEEYFKSLTWDGTSRIETLTIDWLGVEDTPLMRDFSFKWILSAVKRALEPGCMIEGMLILQGAQGIGKTTFCERLASTFKTASKVNISDPRVYVDILKDSWIVEFDELATLRKKEQDEIKTFLTTTHDLYRGAYKEYSEYYERHNVFIGSTNDETFIRDYSGESARRFWVCKCDPKKARDIYKDFTPEIVNQVWAEAYQLYLENPNMDLNYNRDLFREFEEHQEQFKTINEDDKVELLKEVLDTPFFVDEKGYFKNEDDFISQANGTTTYEESVLNKINRIPIRWVNDYLSKNGYGRDKSNYLLSGIKKEWKKERQKYNGRTEHCFCRIESIPQTTKKETHLLFPFELKVTA